MMGKNTMDAGNGDRMRKLAVARLSGAIALGLLCCAPLAVSAQTAQGQPAAKAADAGAKPAKKAGKKSDEKNATQLATVTVTGMRASVESAEELKQNADQIVDSITAVNMNALPDRSITEALQRVSGVTIDHFLASNDPDHPSAEGTDVSIRGLSEVESLLNGRESFSASNGRSLSFEDVPAEMMAGVDVYKNPSAEMIEGGIGGTINLRTRVPFDAPGQVVAFSWGVNKGDLSQKSKPSGSFLYSNRWTTENWGEFGALLDVSDSELATRSDGIEMEPYTQRNDAPVLAGSNLSVVYVPNGADWRRLDFNRRRIGISGAFQWRPNQNLQITSQFIRSRYDMSWLEHGAIYNNGAYDPATSSGLVYPVSGTDYDYDGDGVFQSGYMGSSVYLPGTGPGTGENTGVNYETDTRYQTQTTVTTDFSNSFKYNLSENMLLSGSVQFVKSTSNTLDFTVFQTTYLPDLYLNTAGSNGMPLVSVGQPGFTSNPANYYWSAAMDHFQREVGMERAYRLDLEYDFEDSNWLQYFKVGVRATDRTENDVDTIYNWQAISQPWWAEVNTPTTLANVNYFPTYATLYSFSNFMRGDVHIPSTMWFPGDSLVENYGAAAARIHAIGTSDWNPVQVTPADLNNQGQKTKAAYGILYFGNDTALGIPFDGNIGVRLVRTDVNATGVVQYPNLSSNQGLPLADQQWVGGYQPLTGRTHYQDALPSLNLRFKFTDDLQLRLAASKAISRPSFADMQEFVQLGATTTSTGGGDTGTPTTTTVQKWTGYAGNPDLKPMRATQFDSALEWYFSKTGLLYTTLFYKRINNYIAQETHPETYNG